MAHYVESARSRYQRELACTCAVQGEDINVMELARYIARLRSELEQVCHPACSCAYSSETCMCTMHVAQETHMIPNATHANARGRI